MTFDEPRPYRPTGGVTLHGPFLTAAGVRARIGRSAVSYGRTHTLLSIGCPIGAGKAYPAFQFDEHGQTREAAFLATLLVRRVSHEEACDWLVRRNPALAMETPLAWLLADGDVQWVIDALPHPSRRLPGTTEMGEAEILEFTRRAWTPQPYQARAAA